MHFYFHRPLHRVVVLMWFGVFTWLLCNHVFLEMSGIITMQIKHVASFIKQQLFSFADAGQFVCVRTYMRPFICEYMRVCFWFYMQPSANCINMQSVMMFTFMAVNNVFDNLNNVLFSLNNCHCYRYLADRLMSVSAGVCACVYVFYFRYLY